MSVPALFPKPLHEAVTLTQCIGALWAKSDGRSLTWVTRKAKDSAEDYCMSPGRRCFQHQNATDWLLQPCDSAQARIWQSNQGDKTVGGLQLVGPRVSSEAVPACVAQRC